MHTALFNDRFEIAKLLIAHHADVNAREDYKRRPLHLAASRNSVETAKLLIAYHADSVNAREDYKRTPLHTAASSNSIKTAKLLIAHHADVNARGYLDHTPLIDAGREGNREMEALLRQHGAIDRWRS